MNTQDRTHCFDRNHDHTIGADTNSSFWCRTCHPYGRLVSSKTETQDRTIRDVIKDLSDWMEKIDRIESHGYPDRNNEYFEESLYTLVEELLNQPEKKCIGCNPELAGKDGGSPGHTCEATPGTALVEKQNKTIIFEIKINGEFNKIISDISLINGVESVQDITEEISVALKQPEKQEIEKLNIEATPTIAYAGFIIISNKLNEVIESHNELQEVVNKLLEK